MDVRQKILDVTEQMCTEMLPQKITLDMVAAKAKVGKGTIYTHFSCKDDLFQKLALTLVEKLRTQMMDAGLSSKGNSLVRLSSLNRAFHGFMQQHPMIIAITVFLRDKPPWLESEEEEGGLFQLETVYISMIESLVKLGVEEGLFRTDISTRILAFFILSVFRASPPMLHKHEDLTDEAVQDLILNGAGS
jgi:AcrR family transcriptional regulator